MKRLLISVVAILGFILPILAQEEPIEMLTLKKGNIPAPVLKAAEQLFEGNTQVGWGAFPYELKDYGWQVNGDYDEPIDHYEIKFKGKDGSDIWAIFESTGELIKCKIINKDSPIPKQVLASIVKSEYKDWKVVSDVMQIKSSQKKVDEHYALKIEKGGMKKTLIYSPQGTLISVR
jgi:hypothetical protein